MPDRTVDDRFQYTLSKPITIAGAVVSVVKMREPKAADFRRVFTKSATERLSQQQLSMNLTADLCSLSEEEFDELSLTDATALIRKMEDFV
jgi:hypothetical protein